MVERRLEHSLYKTLAELQRLRLLRQIDPPTEPPGPKPDNPPRKTNPIAQAIPSPVERIAPHNTTENPTHHRPEPDNGPSSLTIPRPFAIISPSAKAERRRRQAPALQTAARGTTRAAQDRKPPDPGPRPSRGRKLEGLRRP
jgi:hypothetical protein